MSYRKVFLFVSIIFSVIAVVNNLFFQGDTLVMMLILGFSALGWYDLTQKKNAVLREFPVVGHMRYILLEIAPMLHDYFVQSNTEGRPFSKNTIKHVYARSENKPGYHPLGTERDFYKEGVEWVGHSMFGKGKFQDEPRVTVGGPDCAQPYSASILNISAMSFGALSKTAIQSLNKGAALGGFAHNTGEGGLSPYHLEGGDVIMQVGTANFGFRTAEGKLDEDEFCKKSWLDAVKMIEIKLSQGAKPGHGGVLPAAKNTPEIAKIRMVEPHTDVLSPPFNPSFPSEEKLVEFIGKLRLLSGGKPIGIKLCIGQPSEFESLLDQFIKQDTYPDFITVDAAEGGTGAAPLDYSNHIGMRGDDALKFVNQSLIKKNIRERIKVIYAGKVLSGFAMFKAFCYGADLCNSARGFMLSLGCIQSLKCHTAHCPTGVATQNPELAKGIVPSFKSHRVKNFHDNTVEDFIDIAETAGVTSFAKFDQCLISVAEPT